MTRITTIDDTDWSKFSRKQLSLLWRHYKALGQVPVRLDEEWTQSDPLWRIGGKYYLEELARQKANKKATTNVHGSSL